MEQVLNDRQQLRSLYKNYIEAETALDNDNRGAAQLENHSEGRVDDIIL